MTLMGGGSGPGDGSQAVGDILMYPEAEGYINSFGAEPYTIKDIGSPRWLQYHEYVEKLSQQAVLSATTHQNEFVMELLVENEKIGVLIANLIGLELWRENVFSVITRMSQDQFSPKSTLPLYMTLYHEACVTNLFETVLYHRDACESAGESGVLLDLVDYCHRQLLYLSTCSTEHTDSIFDPKLTVQSENETDLQVCCYSILDGKLKKIRFEAALKCVSLVRYFTDHIDSLPVSVVSRMLRTHDMPLLLVHLMEASPWVKRTKDGKLMKLIEGKWAEMPREDVHKLTGLEGQVWLALYQFLFSPETGRKYHMTEHSKAQFSKLVSFLNDVVVDQIPALGQLKETLLRMQMQTFPDQPPSHPIIEQLPEIRDKFEKANSSKWASIAKYQVSSYFSPTDESLRKLALNFASMYESESLDVLLPGVPRCDVCGKDATKRCSRCKRNWYCSRECQVSNWSEHKASCVVKT